MARVGDFPETRRDDLKIAGFIRGKYVGAGLDSTCADLDDYDNNYFLGVL